MNLTNLLDENDISKFDKIENADMYAQEQMFLPEEKTCYKKASELKKENVSNKISEGKKVCFKKAKKMLNCGKKIAEIKEYIIKHFSGECVPEELDNFLNRSNNIIGKVIVDCSSIDNSKEYEAIPFENKRFHQYVIKCNCDNKKKIYKNQNGINEGTIEAYLDTQDNWKEMPIACEICPKTNLPILDKIEDYTENDADVTIKKIGSLSKKEIVSLKKYNPLFSVKKAFCLLDKKGQKKVSFKIEDYNYSLGKNNCELEVGEKGKKDLDITDLKTLNVNVPVCKYTKDVDINDLTPKAIDFQINDRKKTVDVLVNKENISDFDIKEIAIVDIGELKENKMNEEEKIDEQQFFDIIVPEEKSNIEVECVPEKEIIPDFELNSLVDKEWYDKQEEGENIEFDKINNFEIDGRGSWNI
jgi:hypothetical protein